MKIDSKLHRIYVKRSKHDDLPSNICLEAVFNHKKHQKPLKMHEICPKSLGRCVVGERLGGALRMLAVICSEKLESISPVWKELCAVSRVE